MDVSLAKMSGNDGNQKEQDAPGPSAQDKEHGAPGHDVQRKKQRAPEKAQELGAPTADAVQVATVQGHGALGHSAGHPTGEIISGDALPGFSVECHMRPIWDKDASLHTAHTSPPLSTHEQRVLMPSAYKKTCDEHYLRPLTGLPRATEFDQTSLTPTATEGMSIPSFSCYFFTLFCNFYCLSKS